MKNNKKIEFASIGENGWLAVYRDRFEEEEGDVVPNVIPQMCPWANENKPCKDACPHFHMEKKTNKTIIWLSCASKCQFELE